jgi:hypothetical protein
MLMAQHPCAFGHESGEANQVPSFDPLNAGLLSTAQEWPSTHTHQRFQGCGLLRRGRQVGPKQLGQQARPKGDVIKRLREALIVDSSAVIVAHQVAIPRSIHAR